MSTKLKAQFREAIPPHRRRDFIRRAFAKLIEVTNKAKTAADVHHAVRAFAEIAELDNTPEQKLVDAIQAGTVDSKWWLEQH
jgi:hypothetical protein